VLFYQGRRWALQRCLPAATTHQSLPRTGSVGCIFWGQVVHCCSIRRRVYRGFTIKNPSPSCLTLTKKQVIQAEPDRRLITGRHVGRSQCFLLLRVVYVYVWGVPSPTGRRQTRYRWTDAGPGPRRPHDRSNYPHTHTHTHTHTHKQTISLPMPGNVYL